MYWSIAIIELDKVSYWSSIILFLFAFVSDEKPSKYFTYHFLLASYFGGNSVAHENITLPSQPLDDFPVANQTLKKHDLDHLGHFFPNLEGTTFFYLFHKASLMPPPVEKKAPLALCSGKNPRSTLCPIYQKALMVT